MIPVVLAILGDNPMQSEIACHVGLAGRFFCRVCRVKGREAGDSGGGESGDIDMGVPHEPRAGSPSGSEDSAGSAMSNDSTGTGTPKKSRHRKETMQELVDRARRFFSVCLF